jgi:hypothetical protein
MVCAQFEYDIVDHVSLSIFCALCKNSFVAGVVHLAVRVASEKRSWSASVRQDRTVPLWD